MLSFSRSGKSPDVTSRSAMFVLGPRRRRSFDSAFAAFGPQQPSSNMCSDVTLAPSGDCKSIDRNMSLMLLFR